MRRLLGLICVLAILALALASRQSETETALPDFYRQVHTIVWVVHDLQPVLEGWRALGFPEVMEQGEVSIDHVKFRGKPVRFKARVAAGRIGSVGVQWVQPLEGQEQNAYSEFIEKHGSGIFSLVHRVESLQALTDELKRMEDLDVGVLQQEAFPSQGLITFIVYLDTEASGKYTLGLMHEAEELSPQRQIYSTEPPFDRPIAQFAFTIRDPEPVSAFWQRLQFPEISITHGPVRNRMYRGKPGSFDHKLGWQRHGSVVYEWCIPLQGPTAYEDHMKAHGEGFHHLGFQVDNIDAVIDRWTRLGFPVLQSGAWGEEGKPGSGRFAYMDTDRIGGVSIELLWNFD